MGDHTKAEEFLTQWNLFVSVNLNNTAMQNPYQRCLLFLTYLQGPHVNEWVQSQHRWLVNEVTANGVALTNVWLWTTMEHMFRRNFADTLEKECAQAALKQGFQMKGEDMDDYVAKFERLARHAGYNLDDIQTLDLFTAGLPNALYQKVYELDNPQNYAQWKHHALEQQCQWLRVKTRLNKFRPTTQPCTNWGPRPPTSTGRFQSRDPNMMDTSPGQVCARMNTTNTNPPMRGLPAPRGQGQSNGFDIREVTCYGCRQKGHMIRDCPQHTWNQMSTRGGNTFRGHFNNQQ